MQKLYCYVDETGQDTQGAFFLVAVVITSEEREKLRERLRAIEKETGKGALKWFKTKLEQKKVYMERLISTNPLRGPVFYSRYAHTTEYIPLTIQTVAKAIIAKAEKDYEATIFIDGLSRPERRKFGPGLRKIGIRAHKVRGLRDESDEFIRLADAVAGFVRDYFEGSKYTKTLYKGAVKWKIIQEI